MIFKNNLKPLCIILSYSLFFSFFQSQAQSEEIQLAKTYDSIAGTQGLNISNGLLHSNPYPVQNGKYRYFNADKFQKGTVIYNDQHYYDVDIKYDLYNDIIVFKPTGQTESVGIELNPQNVNAFFINGKRFVNLNKVVSPLFTFIKGYYEENISGKNFTFYIKRHKDRREIANGTRIYNEFENNDEYYIYRDNIFHKIASKSDVIALFPDLKKKINDIYSMNKSIQKEDKTQFFEELMLKINNLLENKTH